MKELLNLHVIDCIVFGVLVFPSLIALGEIGLGITIPNFRKK